MCLTAAVTHVTPYITEAERERGRAALNDECGTVMDETEDSLKAQETL